MMMTIALPVLLVMVGLALDGGRAYAVRAKLYSAVDAAVLAAARSVSDGEDAARAAAQKYFNANIGSSYFDSTPNLDPIEFRYDSDGLIHINASASAPMETMLLNVAGWSELDVNVNAETIRRPVDLALVIDNTTSLRFGDDGDVTQDVIDRSKDFVARFNESFDRVSLISYAFGAENPVPFESHRGFDIAEIRNEIDDFEFGGNGRPSQYTNASEGMWNALNQLRTVSDPASLRVIVIFNDGAPNTFSSEFEFLDGSTYSGSIRSGDGRSGNPRGLWEPDAIAEQAPSPYYIEGGIHNRLASLPLYYNTHDPDEQEFFVINPDHPIRPVTNFTNGGSNALYQRVNRVARNLTEDIAEQARKEGIYVLTLGLGSRLTEGTGPDNERGEDLLVRMANDPSMLNDSDLADDFKPDQLQGIYCHAVNIDALAPCFEEMLEVIIRLTI
ncbi:vWA domain-containing protein [Ferrimonas pelagia]|uniref:VWFA domain-containing protein n=1 Tax=Ferrimonas pelagia TaxID=1177826 RepID=A0ABP9EWG4_9GAMM